MNTQTTRKVLGQPRVIISTSQIKEAVYSKLKPEENRESALLRIQRAVKVLKDAAMIAKYQPDDRLRCIIAEAIEHLNGAMPK